MAVIERLATINEWYAKVATEQRRLLAMEMGETECIPTWLANATTPEEIYQLLPVALHAYLDKGMVKEAGDSLAMYHTEVNELYQMSPNDQHICSAVQLRSARAMYFDLIGEHEQVREEAQALIDLAERTGKVMVMKNSLVIYFNIQTLRGESA